MAAEKTFSRFLIHFLLISAATCGSTEDFLSDYDEAEERHNQQISSDNPTYSDEYYSETSTYSGISDPYLDMAVVSDEELQEAATNQSLDGPETLEELTKTVSSDLESLKNESKNEETMKVVENKTDLSQDESVKSSGDYMDKINELDVSITSATETPSRMKITTTTTKTPTTTMGTTTPEITTSTTKSTTTTTKSTEITSEIPTTMNTKPTGDKVVEYSNNGVECRKKCETAGEEYAWCWLVNGSWDYCTPTVVPTTATKTTTTKPTTTTTEILSTTNTKPILDKVVEYSNNGKECKEKCAKQGEDFTWCWLVNGSWDYCTLVSSTPATETPTSMKTTTTKTPTTTTETKSIKIMEVNEVDLGSEMVPGVMDSPFQARMISNDWKMDEIFSKKLPHSAPVTENYDVTIENLVPEMEAEEYSMEVFEVTKNTDGYRNVQVSHLDPESGPNHKMRGEHTGAEQSYNKCFGMSPEPHGKDHPCVFPFIYRGIVYENCTYVADSQPWCATAVDENGHMVSNDWGYCTAACPVMRHNPCVTVDGGPVVGAFCRFPFRYKDLEYNMCTLVDHTLTPDAIEAGVHENQGWCATKVDTHGDYIPHHWGICQSECKPATTEKTSAKPCNTTTTSITTPSSMTTTETPIWGSTTPTMTTPTTTITTITTTTETPICENPEDCKPRFCPPEDPNCNLLPPAPLMMTTPTTTITTETTTSETPICDDNEDCKPRICPPEDPNCDPLPTTSTTQTTTITTETTMIASDTTTIPSGDSSSSPPPMMTTETTTITTETTTIAPDTTTILSGDSSSSPPPETTTTTMMPPTTTISTTEETTTTITTTIPTTTTTIPTTTTMIPTTKPPCISYLPVCDVMCAVDSTMCITGCTENTTNNLKMCKRNCVVGDVNEFCLSECVEAPEECQVTKHIIPYDQLSNQDERAVYIPKVYSDPILEILQEAAIPVEVR